MGLAEYERKRSFHKTSEPLAKKSVKPGRSYVVQKHDATRLHYDFRLELDGVLKSWAVPKGPSLDPAVKRLAIQVEDHPVAYGSFEGTIPAGEYGGGTVLLWDSGDWEPVGNPQLGLREGKLKFVLHGEKLRGIWSLIRTHLNGTSKGSPQWLLIKDRDEEAKPAKQGDILEESPLSVASNRDLDAIANSSDRIWSVNQASSKKSSANGQTRTKSRIIHSQPKVKGTVKESLPSRVDVQLATLTDEPPQGDQWFHEIKFDGYRMICRIDGAQVKFITRNHHDWTDRLTQLVTAAKNLPCKQAVLDGEIVVMQPNGTTDFQSLQNAFREDRTGDLKYYVFDLLYLNGHSYSTLPLQERKSALQKLLDQTETNDVIRYSEHVVGHGEDFKQQACRLHLEGMISKRRDQPYRPGRGLDWLKIKCIHDDEFVIGGFTEPSGSRAGFGALLVGYFDANGELHYAGKVGTGFDAQQLKQLHSRLKSLVRDASPFVDLQRKIGAVRTAHWVKPSLVGQFKYGSWTQENRLRHASFQGLREDKVAHEVKMESPIRAKKAKEISRRSKDDLSSTLKKVTAKSPKGTRSSRRPKKSRLRADAKGNDADLGSESFPSVHLSHPEKVLYPEAAITKLDLANYYQAVADWILPQLAHRPIVIVRCPEGTTGQCFYQKHPGLGTPQTLRRIAIEESRKTHNYLVVDDVQGLIALTQFDALEIHTWGSREDLLEKPDRLVFDLDPDIHVPWTRVVDSARQIRKFLQQLGLESYVKTTGGKGLHLIVPIDRRHDWTEAKAFCKQVAECIVRADPSHYTANLSKAARPNKIFIDYLRNARGATSIVPYSTRARANATVSMPIRWEELSTKLTSDHFTIRTVMSRLNRIKHDPWQEIDSTRQTLSGPLKKLQSLSEKASALH